MTCYRDLCGERAGPAIDAAGRRPGKQIVALRDRVRVYERLYPRDANRNAGRECRDSKNLVESGTAILRERDTDLGKIDEGVPGRDNRQSHARRKTEVEYVDPAQNGVVNDNEGRKLRLGAGGVDREIGQFDDRTLNQTAKLDVESSGMRDFGFERGRVYGSHCDRKRQGRADQTTGSANAKLKIQPRKHAESTGVERNTRPASGDGYSLSDRRR